MKGFVSREIVWVSEQVNEYMFLIMVRFEVRAVPFTPFTFTKEQLIDFNQPETLVLMVILSRTTGIGLILVICRIVEFL